MTSDNGPQFSAMKFARFSEDYGFSHSTSSPLYHQSNGEAERAVKTIKQLLTKAEDPYKALLAYRATPLSNGYSPAQLLMNRRLRTTLPTVTIQLQPSLPDCDVLKEKLREKQKENYDRHHRAKSLEPLEPGDQVWIPDRSSSGTVVEQTAPRSYNVLTPSGEFRRNRRHLNVLPSPIEETSPPPEPDSSDKEQPGSTMSNGVRRSERIPKPRQLFDNSWS